ncbi:hypothetical protein D8B26_002577 [Coccidioides posadasii str. Silveira]|uniref:uncharacterized protein n=1 Tax=Coccidioides posadasii (strain RMSCC 757 / Silveira) TaxID=443226 RepID=UPI001BEE7B13|nr:hypothetical protein D8B26_002577 [Coccidioides posadasii str. Silveira]
MELALRRDGDGFGGPNPHCSGAGRAQYAHRPDRSIVIVQQELRALRCGIRQIEGFDLIAFAIGQTMPVAYCLLLPGFVLFWLVFCVFVFLFGIRPRFCSFPSAGPRDLT